MWVASDTVVFDWVTVSEASVVSLSKMFLRKGSGVVRGVGLGLEGEVCG